MTISRPLLWLVLIVALAANAVTSTMGFSMFLSAAFGLVVIASATALVMQHRRSR